MKVFDSIYAGLGGAQHMPVNLRGGHPTPKKG